MASHRQRLAVYRMSKASRNVIVKKDRNDYLKWLATEEGFLQAFGAVDDDPILWEDFQLDFFRDRSRFFHCNKSRQIGFSFCIAAKSLARTHLRNGYTSVIVSYNLDEAQEKIRYARAFYDNLPLEYQRPLKRDSLSELEFAGYGRKRGSRIKSFPSKAPRGKCGDIMLDEFAHYPRDEEVLTGSKANIIRIKDAQIAMVSTPMGNRGQFWEVGSQYNKAYPDYRRVEIPWWLCSSMCKDIPTARETAYAMPTAQRVELFGKEPLKEQYRNALSDEDFQQEFECAYQDDQVSYYPYDLIQPCTHDKVRVATEIDQIGSTKNCVTNFTGGALVAGFDVGRVKDKSVLTMFEKDDAGTYVLKFRKELHRVRFAEQESYLCRVMDLWPQIARLSIDATGIGRNLAENLQEKYPDRVTSEMFTIASKSKWCINFKMLLQNRSIMLPKDRGLVNQIHAIRRIYTSAGNVVFNSGRTKDGHADSFWSAAMAVQPFEDAAPVGVKTPLTLDVLVIGNAKKRTAPKYKKNRTGKLWIPNL